MHDRRSEGDSVADTPIVNGQLVRARLAPRSPFARASTFTAGRQWVAWLSPISAIDGGAAIAPTPNQHTLIVGPRSNGSHGASVSSSAAIGRGRTTFSRAGLKQGCSRSREAAP